MSAAGGSGWHAFKSNGEHLLPRDAIRVVPRLDPYLMWLEATGYLDVDTVGSGKRQVSSNGCILRSREVAHNDCVHGAVERFDPRQGVLHQLHS